MLLTFVTANRAEIVRRTRLTAAKLALAQKSADDVARDGELFLDYLTDVVAMADGDTMWCRDAGVRGAVLLNAGLSVAQVVREYTDVRQVISDLAFEAGIPAKESLVFNECLDATIAGALSAYAQRASEPR